MTRSTRRALGVGLALVALAGAAAGNSMQRSRRVDAARVAAQGEVDAALPKVVAKFDELLRDVEEKAQAAARLPAVETLVGEITSQSDAQVLAKTFADFEEEPFFTPFASMGPHAFYLGETALYSSDASLSEMLAPLVRKASASGTASALQAWGNTVWAVGVGRSAKTNPQQQPVLFVLAEKVTPELLDPVATQGQAAVLLVPGTRAADAVGAGPAEGLDLLRRLVNSKVMLDPGCCTRKAIGTGTGDTGLELLVHRSPQVLISAAEAEASTSTPLFFGVGGVIAFVGLFLGFRAPKEDDATSAALLRETAAQLKQSQEQLQRISQQLDTNRFDAARAPPAATLVDESEISATRASVQASRYEIVAPLGEGGMARVYVAVVRGAEGFRRTFVLKRLRPELSSNQEAVNQFIDEARLGASLVHSNIVPVFDFGRDAEGYFLAQEYILGRDVDAIVQASKTQRDRALELPVVLLIAQEALKALGYAHTRHNDAGKPMGLVHRDVSPNNLMVSARGEVKLLDFGIVKSDDRVTKTQAGVVKGNLFFMSPEQARALPVDPRADLFSLGMVLFSAVTGTPLYSGNNVYELMTRAAAGPTDDDRARVTAETGPLAPVILKALSFDPAARFENAEDFARALGTVGAAASPAELQTLMETLFTQAFADERQKFAVAS